MGMQNERSARPHTGTWIGILGCGLGGIACFAGALLAGFIGILIASDEALAARPFFWAAYGLVIMSFVLLGGAITGAVVGAVAAAREAS